MKMQIVCSGGLAAIGPGGITPVVLAFLCAKIVGISIKAVYCYD
jgi:hypothetical protein